MKGENKVYSYLYLKLYVFDLRKRTRRRSNNFDIFLQISDIYLSIVSCYL